MIKSGLWARLFGFGLLFALYEFAHDAVSPQTGTAMVVACLLAYIAARILIEIEEYFSVVVGLGRAATMVLVAPTVAGLFYLSMGNWHHALTMGGILFGVGLALIGGKSETLIFKEASTYRYVIDFVTVAYVAALYFEGTSTAHVIVALTQSALIFFAITLIMRRKESKKES